jgi:hypothetical protein
MSIRGLIVSIARFIPFSPTCLVSGTAGRPANWLASSLLLVLLSTWVLLTLLARLGVFSTSDAWETFSGAFAALLLLSGGQLALLLDWRRWCGRRWVEVAKHCDAVHWAGAGVAVVMLVARFATRVSLEENIAGECDVLGV